MFLGTPEATRADQTTVRQAAVFTWHQPRSPASHMAPETTRSDPWFRGRMQEDWFHPDTAWPPRHNAGSPRALLGAPPRHSAVILLGGSRRGTRAFPPGFPRASMNRSSCSQEAARDPELLGLKGTQASRVLQMLTQPGIRAMPAACKAHALPPQLQTQGIFLELPCPTVRAAAKTRSRSAAPESVVGGRGQ